MSESVEKKKRRILKAEYMVALERWRFYEPPRWRFIRYRKWQKAKPKRTW